MRRHRIWLRERNHRLFSSPGDKRARHLGKLKACQWNERKLNSWRRVLKKPGRGENHKTITPQGALIKVKRFTIKDNNLVSVPVKYYTQKTYKQSFPLRQVGCNWFLQTTTHYGHPQYSDRPVGVWRNAWTPICHHLYSPLSLNHRLTYTCQPKNVKKWES